MSDTFVVDATSGKATILKDPEADLDYIFDWSAWLADDGDTINTVASELFNSDFTAIDASDTFGLSNAHGTNPSISGQTVVFWLKGGTIGNKYAIRSKITTISGRIDVRTFYVSIKDR